MTTKFNPGDGVLIKATIEKIDIYKRNGNDEIIYKLSMDSPVKMDTCGRWVAPEECLFNATNEQNGILD